jgi:hypothetical protein
MGIRFFIRIIGKIQIDINISNENWFNSPVLGREGCGAGVRGLPTRNGVAEFYDRNRVKVEMRRLVSCKSFAGRELQVFHGRNFRSKGKQFAKIILH